VVDNHSQDDSLNLVSQQLDEKLKQLNNFVLVRNTENEGWCKAINAGISKANGDIIIFSNHDVIYKPDSLSKIVTALNVHENVGICQFNCLLPSGEPDVAASFLDPLGYAYSFLSNQTTYVTFGEAVAIAVKSQVIKTIGRLDEDYFIEYEDQDFCWRALLFGFKILFIHDAMVTHYRGSVEKPNFFVRGKRVFLYTRNHIYTLMKNLEFHNLIKYLPEVLVIECCKGFFVLFVRRNFNVSMKIFKGIFSSFAHMGSLSKKRRAIQKNRKLPDKDVFKTFVPFMPSHQLNYLKYQGEGRRYVIDDASLLKELNESSSI
jgi:hypothetical protein